MRRSTVVQFAFHSPDDNTACKRKALDLFTLLSPREKVLSLATSDIFLFRFGGAVFWLGKDLDSKSRTVRRTLSVR